MNVVDAVDVDVDVVDVEQREGGRQGGGGGGWRRPRKTRTQHFGCWENIKKRRKIQLL